jgi:GTP pyrophosphokinase
VTISSGITIHRTDCPNAARLRENYPYRVMEARWRSNADGAFRATIAVVAVDTSGLANQVTEIITRELKLNIRMFNFASRGDGMVRGTISVEVPSSAVVDTLIHSLTKIKGVQRAYRVNN